MSNWFKIAMAATTFIAWAKEAAKDGKIDAAEVMELVSTLLDTLDIKAEIVLK